jgi:multidrug efflux pump subunit AcrA (membrane-fusion protein)
MSLPDKFPRWSKLLLRTVLLLLVLAGIGWGGRVLWRQLSPTLFGSKRQETVPTTKVRTASIAEEIVAVGRLRAVFSTELRSEITGRIVKIRAVDGQKVTRDEEILRLDQQDLLTQIQEVERNIEAAKLKAQRARRDHERLVDLKGRGVVTMKDFEDSRIVYSLSENDAAIAEARAANLRDKLTKTVIRAPHDGTLLLKDLTDLSVLMVRTNINEIDVARIKMADAARVRVDSMRSVQMTGTVKRIATSALESSSDRTRVFPVDVYLDETDGRLRPGMSATVFFTLARVDDVLAVPLNAVFSTAESVRYVFIRKGEGFEVHPIETGIADTRYVQVLSGLEIGTEVARTRPLEFEGELPVPVLAPAVKSKTSSSPGAAASAPPGGPPPPPRVNKSGTKPGRSS